MAPGDESSTLGAADYQRMLSELSKYGASFILVSQSLAKLDAIDRALRPTIFSNIDGLTVFQVSAEDGPHILLYFYDIAEMVEFYEREVEGKKGKSPYMATGLPTVDLLGCSDRYNCVRAAAHPYGYLVFNKGVAKCIEKQYFAEETLSRFEAVEVINGGMRRNLNRKASNLAVRKGLGLVGGTDGHTLKDLGNIVTCAESADVEGFLNAVVHRQSFVVGREKNLLDKSVTAALLMTRYVPYTVPSIAVHYRQNMPRVQRFVQRRTSRRPKTRAKVK